MRMVLKFSFVCLLVLAILIPAAALFGQLPQKMEKFILPGTTHVSYAGQNFIFTTSTSLQVTFMATDINKIRITVKVRLARGEFRDVIPNAGGSELQILWVNWNSELYSGEPPDDPWTVILDTESGYTEK
ncbi:MAG: hypothetical protein GTO51_02645 [Candidatus Latescibacteria bacterium]|nr:hypothetical protein [Candidatus Latescibacterota bacterium]NIM22581.1 hypothetical protein [Candidatus Latescibacterota bacterium]NIM64870.1 hypothetical protein [Candidatus Latescibacterota bacterium]NIO01385.1 hypothetical protein [Candidatus Latescibacterota bacterium]NIO27895.1 hypothetical protein [Candidatus Latescibacterota bacterium]